MATETPVKRGSQFRARSLSTTEYIHALHQPDDRVAVVLVNRRRSQTLQRIASAETIAAAEFQEWLCDRNRAGWDIFIGMNPLKRDADRRSKEQIREVRHLYLDLDENAEAALRNVGNSLAAPPPNFVLDTSPGKHQVVWKVAGADAGKAESLLRGLAWYFGGDPAATDVTRVLRLPGFVNRKYVEEREFAVSARQESGRIHSLGEFSVGEGSLDAVRAAGLCRPRRQVRRGHRSQSEADWAYAKRALARGDDPREVIERIASFRARDKRNSQDYAKRTVGKAKTELWASPDLPEMSGRDR